VIKKKKIMTSEGETKKDVLKDFPELKKEYEKLMTEYIESTSDTPNGNETDLERAQRKLQHLQGYISSQTKSAAGAGGPTNSTQLAKDVEKMIEKAKRDSEVKVKQELSRIRKEIEDVRGRLTGLATQVQKEQSQITMAATQKERAAVESVVDKKTLTEFVQKIETRWMSEMNILKQELHQTIMAHNHNADLMKHLKDAMDHIRIQLDERSLLRPDQWIRWMPHVEQFLTQSTQRDRQLQSVTPKLDSLLLRVETLESQFLSLFPGSGALNAGGNAPGTAPAGQTPGQYMLTGGSAQAPARTIGWGEEPPITLHQTGQQQAAKQGGRPGSAQGSVANSQQGSQMGKNSQKMNNDMQEFGNYEWSPLPPDPSNFFQPSDEQGSERSGNKPAQRKLSANMAPVSGSPNAGGMDTNKLESVGAPPGLPPPPGL